MKNKKPFSFYKKKKIKKNQLIKDSLWFLFLLER